MIDEENGHFSKKIIKVVGAVVAIIFTVIILIIVVNVYSGKFSSETPTESKKAIAESGKKVGKIFKKDSPSNIPKQPVTIFRQEYTGQGIVGKVFIPTAQSGKDYVEGDKIIVSGTKFRVYNGVWEDCQTKYEVFCRSPVNGKFFYIAAEEGVKVTVEVQRFM